MPLYGMQTPNGYSWMSEPWVSTGALVTRMNFALVLSGDKLPGVRTDWTKMLNSKELMGKSFGSNASAMPGDVDPEAAVKERKLELLLLGTPLSERTRTAVIAHSNDSTVAIQAARDFQGGVGPTGVGVLAGEYNLGGAQGKAKAQNPVLAMAPRNAAPDDRQAAVIAGLLLGSPEFQRR